MNQLLTSPNNVHPDTVSPFPSVSIIMPFEPKMKSKRQLAASLNNAVLKAEQDLLENFSVEISMLLVQKLKSIVDNLNYSTHKRSVAIFVSPVFEKVLYLDLEVLERIIVDDSFAIRELINSKNENRQYLLLALSNHESKMFFENGETLAQIFCNRLDAYSNGAYKTERHRKATFIETYLRHIDGVLDIIFPSFKAPLFVVGEKNLIEMFKNITKHSGAIIRYIENETAQTSRQELKKVMARMLRNWQGLKRENLRTQLKQALSQKRVSIGIEDVFREAMHRRGHLLLVEKNYRYPSEFGGEKELLEKATAPYSQFSYIKDSVDDIIEKVLEENGDVEFVDEEMLEGLGHIALIN